MQSVIRYLKAIEGINEVDRALLRLESAAKRGRPPHREKLTTILVQLVAAHEAAHAAWRAVNPRIKRKLEPPPDRYHGGNPPWLPPEVIRDSAAS